MDIDGTTLHDDASIGDAVIERVRRLGAAGHQVMPATGRFTAATVPGLKHLGITPQYLVRFQRSLLSLWLIAGVRGDLRGVDCRWTSTNPGGGGDCSSEGDDHRGMGETTMAAFDNSVGKARQSDGGHKLPGPVERRGSGAGCRVGPSGVARAVQRCRIRGAGRAGGARGGVLTGCQVRCAGAPGGGGCHDRGVEVVSGW
ncbi:HAD hydrolase family protein [Kribbella sp. NPDC050241]|uniref:HAD hydrolase family protein n=1 Tax=Kribbella sp. NPDC050241 TaxID=3364115 RepID=UPI0037ADB0FA